MLVQRVYEAAEREESWAETVRDVLSETPPPIALHLAVLIEPYLAFVLDGSKTVESRFSRNACAPFGRVNAGDVVLLKRAAGPVVGACTVTGVWDYRITPTTWTEILDRFGEALCPQDGFWDERRHAMFATLMRVEDPRPLPPVDLPKRDRRGWVVLADMRVPTLL
jgi:hypothetical protein